MTDARTRGVDTSAGEIKIMARQRVARTLGREALVFEACAGEGGMYASCWHKFAGICCDLNSAKVRTACESRSRWLCFEADSFELVRSGGIATIPFDVIDLDFYGSPWATWFAYLETQELFAEQTHVFLTDGFASRSKITGPDKTLFPGLGRSVKLTTDAIINEARRRTDAVCHERGLTSRWVRTDITKRGTGMVYHYLVIGVG